MTFEFWALSGSPYFSFPIQVGGYVLLMAYALFALLALGAAYRDFTRLNIGGWAGLIGLALLAPALSAALIVRFPGGALLPPPGVPVEPRGPGLPLFGSLPILLAGGMLGMGPAILVGFGAGLARAGWETFTLFPPFEYALLGGLAGYLLRQDYRGAPSAALRHPFVAGGLAALLVWPLRFLSLWAHSPAGGLTGLDYTVALWTAAAPALVGEALIGGALAELARAAVPGRWPPAIGTRPPPYARSLNRRLLFSLIPLAALGIAGLFWADTRIAINVATRLVVDQMSRDALHAASGIPFFIQTGRSLIRNLAADDDLLNPDPAARQAALVASLRSVPYFRQLILFDQALSPAAAYPAGDLSALALSPEEQQMAARALQGIPDDTTVYPAGTGRPVTLAFVGPITDPTSGAVVGALLGRADIENNPLMTPVINNLEGLLVGSGQGFIVDDRGRIIFHPDSAQLLESWAPETSALQLPAGDPAALAYQDRAPDGTRRLVYYLPSAGHPWSVVIIVPYQVVLSLATQISTQILIILILIGGIGLILISLIAGRLTRPLEMLAGAAAGMTEGALDRAVQVTGEDEVGRLGLAFERMRVRLKARLEELSLLLGVTQSVAGSLNLDDAVPPILQGALTATGAGGARLVIPQADEAAPKTFALGAAAGSMAPLDAEVLTLTRTEGRLILDNLSRPRALLNTAKVAGRIGALIALPLRQEAVYYGALWLGYLQPHTFTEAEVNFLTTLAGQAAVAVANARLFAQAEGERQRLAAILASTPDAVIVTDRHLRVLLVNPAAEAFFGLAGRPSANRPLAEVIDRPELIDLLGSVGATTLPPAREVPLADGRTLYASASIIRGIDGDPLGRVAVLRDVTHFKEIDQLKSEFVATVSHDLRSPLTFMRGYATMLPMVGALNEKQKEFADKIVVGIGQMSELIDNLLDLGRIEAGVGLAREACRVEALINEAIGGLQLSAANKRLALTVDLPRGLPPISGDPVLLRQAVANLVDNAIKYTPEGGRVKIRGEVKDGNLIIAVRDTGVGIAQADQVRLFEKFYRVRQRETVGVKGSGLGLAIVKSIAERHGGRVWVESQLGQGSTFFVAVPVDGK